MANNIKIIKLITGEDLLAEVVEDGIMVLTIKNVVRIAIVPSKANPNTPSIGLAPWGEFSDEKSFTINKNAVVTTMNPVNEFINQYNSIFGGIITPSTKLVL